MTILSADQAEPMCYVVMLVFDFMLLPIDFKETDTLEILYSLLVHIRFLASDKLIILLLLFGGPIVKSWVFRSRDRSGAILIVEIT